MDDIEEYAVALNGPPQPELPNNTVTRSLQVALGPPGQDLAQHPKSYRRDYPDSLLILNAGIWCQSRCVWFGDLDLSNNDRLLSRLAQQLRRNLYVTPSPQVKPGSGSVQAVARPNLNTLELRTGTAQYRRGELRSTTETALSRQE